MTSGHANVTELLQRWSGGDPAARDLVLEALYRELHQLASGYFRQERQDHTLQATGLLHEAYMRLIEAPKVDWSSRAHFIALAANVMRRVLVEHARHRNRLKRGGGRCQITLSVAEAEAGGIYVDLETVDDALRDLERWDVRKARIVELRFFGGLTHEEIADELGISVATVAREWRKAKAWLFSQLVQDPVSTTESSA